MPEYTPTTEDLCAAWWWHRGGEGAVGGPGSAFAEFDRWFAARDRENRAIGWDEGVDAANGAALSDVDMIPNPHRTEAKS